MFLHDTGLRVSEMTALLWKDVDLDRRIILIRNNKGSKDFRTVPLTNRATRILSDHQDAMVKSDLGELYPRLERNLRDQLGIAASKAKIRHVHPHIFRHTFTTELVDEGVPLETIQKLLGHKGISMTLRYAKKRGKGLREAINVLQR
jgi:integrase